MSHDVLIVNANPLLNLVHAGEFVHGAINRLAALPVTAEGKGVNVARCLARFGHSVIITGFAGGHSGAWLRDLVAADGIDDAWVQTAAPLRVGFMATAPDSHHPTTVMPNGFPVTRDECARLLERVATRLRTVRLVIASGSVPDPAADDLYDRLLALCAEHGVPCWLDAYGDAMSRALNGAAPMPLAKPNREEYALSRNWERVDELHLTDGGAAAEVRSNGAGNRRLIPPEIRQVNPIGSGDCYIAGLAHGWLLGLPWDERLRLATAAGAANALRHDVAGVTLDDIELLRPRVRVERLY